MMAHDEQLADRIRALLALEPGITEQRMFGGLAFLVDRHMAVAASGQGGLMVRVDPAEAEALLREPLVEAMVMRGRELRGWLRVASEAVEQDAALEVWVRRGVAYAGSLPPKDGSPPRPGA